MTRSAHNSTDIGRLLHEDGARQISRRYRSYALQNAILNRSWDALRELLDAHADILRTADSSYMFDKDMVVWTDYNMISITLRKKSVAQDVSDRFHSDLLYMASVLGKEDVVTWLVNTGIDVNVHGPTHSTARLAAVGKGQNQVSRILHGAGACRWKSKTPQAAERNISTEAD